MTALPKLINDYTGIIEVPSGGIADQNVKLYNQQKEYLKNPKINNILIPADVLQKRIVFLAAEIASKHPEPVLEFIVILNGAFMLAADLCRAMTLFGKECHLQFIKTTTYGNDLKKNIDHPEVKILLDATDIAGKDLIIIEDIIDQGFTLKFLKSHLINEAKSVEICTLLFKNLDNPTQQVADLRKELVPNYIGFTIPDIWIAGFGIDAANDFREIPEIVTVQEELYR